MKRSACVCNMLGDESLRHATTHLSQSLIWSACVQVNKKTWRMPAAARLSSVHASIGTLTSGSRHYFSELYRLISRLISHPWSRRCQWLETSVEGVGKDDSLESLLVVVVICYFIRWHFRLIFYSSTFKRKMFAWCSSSATTRVSFAYARNSHGVYKR